LFLAGSKVFAHLETGANARAGDWAGVPMILSERGLARERVDAWFRTHDEPQLR
jgi:hypothetical protein